MTEESKAGRVAITGVAGYLAGRVAAALAGRGRDVAGIDVRTPARPPGYPVHRADVRDPSLSGHLAGCDTLVHMAFVVEQPRDAEAARSVNVDGTRNVLEAAKEGGVRKVVVASSVSAYGPWPDNPPAIPETWPCRGHPRSYYARHKAEVEGLLDDFEAREPTVTVVRLRPYVVAGPHLTNFIARVFLRPAVLGLVGEDPLLPLVHEDDLARAFVLAVEREVRGAFNVGAPDPLRWSEMARLAGSRVVKIPAGLAGPLSDVGFRLRLAEFGHDWVVLLRGQMVMDLGKARRELGFTAERTAREAWLDFLRARKPAAYARALRGRAAAA